MKGKIINIRTIFNDVDAVIGYAVVVEFDTLTRPDLKLGGCDIKQ